MTSTPPSALQVPLFPLPGVVHFPRTELPLHIFEPRYRQMVADLEKLEESQRFVGMALLENGPGGPQVYRTGTAGLLKDVEPLDDGRSNIVLEGRFRFRIEREVGGAPYQQASVKPLPERSVVPGAEPWSSLAAELDELLPGLAREMEGNFALTPDDVQELLAASDLERTTNSIAARLEVSAAQKMRLLSQELDERCTSVLRVLRGYRRSLDLLLPFRHLAKATQNN